MRQSTTGWMSVCIALAFAGCAQIIGIEDLPPACGDGYRQPEEACDDGNTVSGDGCNATCTSDETCGNSLRDPGETCDDGGNSIACNANCTRPACGDSFLNPEAGERCEDGNDVAGDGCVDCRLECGNGVVDRNEECDGGDRDGDGFADDTAVCDNDCSQATCGDGYINANASEDCDEAGIESSSCDADCTAATCGDGYLNAVADEQCDDGADTEACDSDCTSVECGDGHLNLTLEECDDGNVTNEDGCEDQCSETPGESCNSYIDLGDIVVLAESEEHIAGNAFGRLNNVPLLCDLSDTPGLSAMSPDVMYSFTASRDIPSLNMYFLAEDNIEIGNQLAMHDTPCEAMSYSSCYPSGFLSAFTVFAGKRYYFAVYSTGPYELMFRDPSVP